MIGSDHEDIVVLDAGLVDLTNGLVGGSDTLNSSLVDTSVTHHVRGSEVVHNEVEVLLSKTLGHLGADLGSAHLGVKIVGSHAGRGNHVTDFAGELLLDTAVEEESDVSVLLSLSNVSLLQVLLGQPFGQDVAHVLGREGNGESVVGLVLGHGGNGDVLRVREVGSGGAVVVTQKLSDLTNTVRAVVEEEQGVVV